MPRLFLRVIIPFIINIWFFAYGWGECYCEESLGLSGKYKDYNVILIILDALRPDHLSCYGYSKETSPNIDKLAKEGVVFSQAFSQSFITLPCVMSIFSSLYSSSHGVEYVFKDKIPDKIYTLAEILNIYGYNTAWLGTMGDPHTGKADGLLSGYNELYDISIMYSTTLDKYDQIFSLISKYQGKPFFLTVHSYLVHELHFPFSRFNNRFNVWDNSYNKLNNFLVKLWENMGYTCENNPGEFDKILGTGWSKKNVGYFTLPYSITNFDKFIETQDSLANKQILVGIWNRQIKIFLNSLDKKELLSFLSLLDSAIYELDKDFIGRLVNELKENNLYEHTLIIITADHGNQYGEHGSVGHGYSLYDEEIRIPLIFYLPHFNKAIIIDSLAQGIDILPTVLDLLGIPPPYQAQGISLTGLIEKKPGAFVNDYVFAKTLNDSFFIRSKQWKLIRKNINSDSFNDELYNIQKDPLEKNNLINIETVTANILKAELEAKISSLPIYNRKNSEFIPEIDPESRERIRKTGYW